MSPRGRLAATPIQRQIDQFVGVPGGRRPFAWDEAIERFWSRVDRSGGPDSCWPWSGPPSDTGYGQITIKNVHWNTHAFAYYVTKFGVPDGLHIDHECHNGDLSCKGGRSCRHRLCCNPAHLGLATPGENALRAAIPRNRAYNERCPKGHVIDGVLTRKSGPKKGKVERFCKTCNRISTRRAVERRKGRY